MNIFSLKDKVLADYQSYVTSFLNIADDRIREFVEAQLRSGVLWPEPLVQLSPSYEAGQTIEELVSRRLLHRTCSSIFEFPDGFGRKRTILLYKHQQTAIQTALRNEHFVLTSGTGSGKSLAYLIPAFDFILKNRPEHRSVRAIIVYPTNALINSQADAIRQLLRNLPGGEETIRVASYTGQENDATKQKLQTNPPHVLLTNYMMLELMLTRPQEAVFVERGLASLRIIVLDELHTYRGRQGADVALLMRRLRERSGNQNILCIGTSTTMATGGSRAERRGAVAAFASKVFGVPVEPENVIEETLRRSTAATTNVDSASLTQSLTAPLPQSSVRSFSRNPLSKWIEDTFGIEQEEDGFLKRRVPITLKQGARKLADLTQTSEDVCEERLRQMLLLGSQIKGYDGNPVLPFILHQFVSQGGSVYSTVERPENRFITLEGQIYAPGETSRFLYPLVFCRICGQEYYAVEWHRESKRMFPGIADLAEPLQETAEEETIESGYIMLDPDGVRTYDETVLPDHWLDTHARLSRNYRSYRPREIWVKPTGEVSESQESQSTHTWFVREPFMLCLGCGEAYTSRDTNDFRKLARLSSEGRSTATTLLTLSSVAAMRDTNLAPAAQKVLSFTDNRQDASLQAGHFNDFVQVALLRSALYQALKKHNRLRFDQIAARVVEEMGLPLPELARTPDLDPSSSQADHTRKAFLEVIEYHLYEDLRRDWRVVQPNLERSGLFRMEYDGLDALAADDSRWTGVNHLNNLAKEDRLHLLRAVLDEIRRQLAIQTDSLNPQRQEEMRRRSREYLNERWAIDENERLRYAGKFILPNADKEEGDQRLSRRSVIGRWLYGQIAARSEHKPDEQVFNNLVSDITSAFCRYGLLVEAQSGKFQLRASSLIWQLGDGTVANDLPRRYKAEGDVYQDVERKANEFFRGFYAGKGLTLKHMEGAEHTAQIRYERRIDREQKFKDGSLAALFCSPTMELGIDIKDLNAVHLRNIPPTPANYAQRSCRAGRAGQPALVLAYSSFGSGHDQYFFKRREKMVAGAVVTPRLDLTNEDVLRSHVHSIWLAKTRVSLHNSMLEILDTNQEGYPQRDEIRAQIHHSGKALEECTEECKRVLRACGGEIESAEWFTPNWLGDNLHQVEKRFDRAFDRWRELFRSARNQLLQAQALKQQRYLSRTGEDRLVAAQAEMMEREAERQLDLLCARDTKPDESDFYPYRYLASEGFLPGYDFAAAPVRAYIPRGDDGEFIGRARFLAISEFGPMNIIYHEGAKYQVRQVFLPPKEPERLFAKVKICNRCGYLHEGESVHVVLCEKCNTQLTGANALYLGNLLEMPTVAARQRERITCDEEDRLRQGYDLTTHFRFAPIAGGGKAQRRASTIDASNQSLLELTYAPAANLWRVNHQWKRSDELGYRLDMSKGYWQKRVDNHEHAQPNAGQQFIRSNVRLFVRNTANLLLLHATREEDYSDESFMSSLQYAVSRGIQVTYEVEERELAAERIGQSDQRSILLWEAAEGGLGVLRRLTDETDAVAQVARAALQILHFDPETGADSRPPEDPSGCAKACYDCLLSYYNQRDHIRLDRHRVKDYLLSLTQSITHVG